MLTLPPRASIAPLLLASLALVACSSNVVTPPGSTGGSSSSSSSGSTQPIVCSGDNPCPSGMLCSFSPCYSTGEECFFTAPDGGMDCGPNATRAPQFDADCPSGGFACEPICPPPVCIAVPASCGPSPACSCFATDPCAMWNGLCNDSGFSSGELICN